MRFVLELWDRYFQMESGLIVDDTSDPDVVEADEDEEVEVIRLPLGFQAPPKVEVIEDDEDDEDESEAPEADCG